ncbi:MAG: cellulase family glycosylhydrolase [Candidatus Sumerlaeota bacterium]|nr:cellulase family glycosylhydrolase [Candidatus Sumerlaeota bacterium]
MNRMLFLGSIAAMALTIAGIAIAQQEKMEWIKVSGDGAGFVGATSGKPFVPWGFNYDRDYKMRLIEEYWDAEWATVVEDFREMKSLGANVVRVHLQFGRMMESADKPNSHTLERLADLVKLAEQTGLRLDLTGLACYRKKEEPAWYKALDEGKRWEAQAHFWEAVAMRCADSPAIFCYDLMNEPIVAGGRRTAGDWLTGELAGFTYCQFITLDSANRPRGDIARQWVAQLAKAIRKHDQRRMITVGLLPNSHEGPGFTSGFLPNQLTDSLDYLSVHIYPDHKKLEDDMKLLKRFRTAKPLVIEEIFPMNCSAKELESFIRDSRRTVSGWIGFYWGKPPEQMRGTGDFSDALTLGWLDTFQKLGPEMLGK